MKIQPSLYYLGLSCFPISLLSLLNIFYSYYFEYLLDVNSYIIVLLLSLIVGFTFFLLGKSKKDDIGIYDQIFLVFLIYIFCSFFILIPLTFARLPVPSSTTAVNIFSIFKDNSTGITCSCSSRAVSNIKLSGFDLP